MGHRAGRHRGMAPHRWRPARRRGRPVRHAAALLALAVSAGTAAAVLPSVAGAASATVVKVVDNKTWGPMLVLSNGDALYRLTADPADKSVCSGACAKAWPPVLLARGQTKPKGVGVTGLGTITRTGGKLQVTYKGIPLYLFVGDHSAGQVNGNIKDPWGQWWVVNPAHPHTAPTAQTTSGSSGGGTTSTMVAPGVSY